MSMHCHAYWKSRSEIQAPPCSRDIAIVPMVSTLEGLHCSEIVQWSLQQTVEVVLQTFVETCNWTVHPTTAVERCAARLLVTTYSNHKMNVVSLHLYYISTRVTDWVATHLQYTKDQESNVYPLRDATWFFDIRGDTNRIEELSCTPYPQQEEQCRDVE